MKRCSRCKEEKDESQFQRNRSAKDGLQDQCKQCRRLLDRRTYLNRTPEQTEAYRERERLVIARYNELAYEYLLDYPCVDCGERDPVVLEFDHVGDKRFDVANLIQSSRSWQAILAEIEKCEVRCANCHRRVTAQRLGRWRYIRHLEN